MHPRYNLRDLRVLDTPECETRIALALIAIARGATRQQVRVLLHNFDFRFTDAEFTNWRAMVFVASCLSDEARHALKQQFSDRQTEIIDELRALRLSGVTRDEARKEYGLVFTDSDWTLAQ